MKETEEVTIETVEDVGPYLKSLVALYQKAYKGLEEYAYTKSKDIKGYIEWLFRRDREGFFIAFESGKPIGFIGCDSNWVKNGEHVGEIHEIVVAPEKRGQGVGKKLILTALEYFQKKGLKKSGLWVGEKNVNAQKFYSKIGFKVTEHRGKWIRMEKNLEEAV